MKRTFFILAVVFLGVVNISSLATIGYHRWCRYRENCRYVKNQTDEKDLYTRLSLSSDQISEMHTLKQLIADKMTATELVLREAKATLMDVIETTPTDERKIHFAQKRIDSLQAQLQGIIIQSILREKELLTPDQQKLYFSVIRDRLCGCDEHKLNGGLNTASEGKMKDQCSGRPNNNFILKGGECR